MEPSGLCVVCTAAFFDDIVCVATDAVHTKFLHVESASTQSALTMHGSPA